MSLIPKVKHSSPRTRNNLITMSGQKGNTEHTDERSLVPGSASSTSSSTRSKPTHVRNTVRAAKRPTLQPKKTEGPHEDSKAFTGDTEVDPFETRPRINVDIQQSREDPDYRVTPAVDFDSVPAVAGSTQPHLWIDDQPKPTKQCASCSRSFNIETIQKHEKACSKIKRRTQFNSKQHRLAELNDANSRIKTSARFSSATEDIPIKRAGWKEKSDQLRAAVALARATDPEKRRVYEAELARVSEASLTRCEFCRRSFNTEAARRHIPICKSKAMVIPRTVPGKLILAGAGASIKLPSLGRSRSEAPEKTTDINTSSRKAQSKPGKQTGNRGSSLIKSYFR